MCKHLQIHHDDYAVFDLGDDGAINDDDDAVLDLDKNNSLGDSTRESLHG